MFGIELVDAGLGLSLMIALTAGLISFLSPCVLPIVPAYLAYMTGASVDDMRDGTIKSRQALIISIFFVLGLSTVFIVMGISFSALGAMIKSQQLLLARISGVLIVVFGLHFLGVLRIPFLMREMRLDAPDQNGSAFGAYLLGLAFAFGWTPCIGPMLGSIIGLVANGGDVGKGALLMIVYAMGLGLPFILCAVFFSRALSVMTRIRPHLPMIEKAMGGFLIFVGLLMFFGVFSNLSNWLLNMFPSLSQIG